MIGDISKAEHIYIAVGYTDMRKPVSYTHLRTPTATART